MSLLMVRERGWKIERWKRQKEKRRRERENKKVTEVKQVREKTKRKIRNKEKECLSMREAKKQARCMRTWRGFVFGDGSPVILETESYNSSPSSHLWASRREWGVSSHLSSCGGDEQDGTEISIRIQLRATSGTDGLLKCPWAEAQPWVSLLSCLSSITMESHYNSMLSRCLFRSYGWVINTCKKQMMTLINNCLYKS